MLVIITDAMFILGVYVYCAILAGAILKEAGSSKFIRIIGMVFWPAPVVWWLARGFFSTVKNILQG
jgi:hypothetical protein